MGGLDAGVYGDEFDFRPDFLDFGGRCRHLFDGGVHPGHDRGHALAQPGKFFEGLDNPGHAALEAPPLKLGANVTHPRFGQGVVTDYEGSGAHARVQVNFDDEGSKWLVLAYANLQVV